MSRARKPKRPGRPQRRGVRKASPGAVIGGMKRMKVRAIPAQAKKREPYKPVYIREKGRTARSMKFTQVISPRHEAEMYRPAHMQMAMFDPLMLEARTSLLSTCIYSFDYDPKTFSLDITFWGYKQRYKAGTWRYYRVPMDIVENLIKASSKGRYFYYNIRTSFQYKRIR